MIENDGTIYVPIKEISSYFGYESYNGEYGDKSEELSKCYSESENEIVPSRSTHRQKKMCSGRDYFSSLLTQRNGSGYT